MYVRTAMYVYTVIYIMNLCIYCLKRRARITLSNINSDFRQVK